MKDKFAFFARYGVQEYHLYDPQSHHLQGWLRTGSTLEEIREMDGWVSPLLEIRFELSLSELRVFGRDGRQFVDVPELDAQREEAQRRAERQRAERRQAEERAERSHLEAEIARQKAERLAAHLRALGIEPE